MIDKSHKIVNLGKKKKNEYKRSKKTLHELIDRIEDGELLTLYVRLLEREIRKTAFHDFFETTESDLVSRAKASIKSVEEGKTRNIKEFKKDVEAGKKDRAM